MLNTDNCLFSSIIFIIFVLTKLNITMDKKLISFLVDNISLEDCRYTYSKMCLERISLRVANNTLWDKFNGLISDFIEDNELGEEWFENNFIDVEEVFEIVLDNYI